MRKVRRATTADREPIVGMVVAAFSADPAWGFICGQEYERIAPLFAGALFDARAGDGTVWATEDASAVSMWDGPERSGDRTALWAAFRSEAGEDAWSRLELYDRALHTHYPREPFWYLGVLATDPSRRREGLASAVLGPGFEQADRAGLKARLETSTTQNKSFYANRGFTESTEVEVDGGPPTWWLTRQAD